VHSHIGVLLNEAADAAIEWVVPYLMPPSIPRVPLSHHAVKALFREALEGSETQLIQNLAPHSISCSTATALWFSRSSARTLRKAIPRDADDIRKLQVLVAEAFTGALFKHHGRALVCPGCNGSDSLRHRLFYCPAQQDPRRWALYVEGLNPPLVPATVRYHPAILVRLIRGE